MTAHPTVGFLHPGMMGASLAAACGAPSLWASEGRSPESTQRAQSAALTDAGSIHELVEASDIIVSICPPAAAEDLALHVCSLGFEGVYVDANAVSPESSRRIAGRFERYVDGSVIGPPAISPGNTRLYLAGEEAAEVAALWHRSVLDARVIDGAVGAASALKMAYASWTKIGAAMLLAVRALAEREGVTTELLAEWELSQPGLGERSELTANAVGPKAWRFIGEMHQMADSFAAADLPDGLATAGAEIYERLASLKGTDRPSLEAVLDLLNADQTSS